MHRYVVVLWTAALAVGMALRAVEIVTHGPFEITYYGAGDSYGGYTADLAWDATSRLSLTDTITMWDSYIADTPARPVQLGVMWDDLAGTTVGRSTNPISGYGTVAYSLTELTWREGSALDPGGHDAFLVFDSGTAWNTGSGLPTASQLDLRSVIAHEIAHTLGFLSTYGLDGTETWWSGGITAWDTFLRDSAGNRPAAGSIGTPGNFDQCDDPVTFVGTNAMAVYGGNPVPIYAPITYGDGSSLTHLNDPAFDNALMEHAIGYGEARRAPNAVELGILADLGWTIVPEPSALTLLVAGLLAATTRRPARPVRHRPAAG